MNTDVRGAGGADAWDDAVREHREREHRERAGRERAGRERAGREDGRPVEVGTETGAESIRAADMPGATGPTDAELAEYEGDDAETHERATYYADTAHVASYGGSEGEELEEPEDAELATYADDGGRVEDLGDDELDDADDADRVENDELDDDIAASAAIGRNADPDFAPHMAAGREAAVIEPAVAEPAVAASAEDQRDLPGTPATDGEPLIAASQEHDFLERWSRAQIGFVEDPHQALTDAEALFEEIMAAQREALEARRTDLTGQCHDNGADTEDLRLAMRGYGQLVSMLLAHAA
jgi:hypothetical protein